MFGTILAIILGWERINNTFYSVKKNCPAHYVSHSGKGAPAKRQSWLHAG
jgi:hypothetical protein